jgi:hypothetical protein
MQLRMSGKSDEVGAGYQIVGRSAGKVRFGDQVGVVA